jgi:hypothetical protein
VPVPPYRAGVTPLAYASPSTLYHLAPAFALCAGLVAAGLVWVAWPALTHALTAAHEGSHGLVASLFGHRVLRIEFYRKGGGKTTYEPPHNRDGSMFVALAGYLGPAMFGVGSAELLREGRAVAMLWISLVFLVVELVMVHNAFGIWSMVVVIGLLLAVILYTPLVVEVFLGYVWVWFLLLGGFRDIFVLHKGRKADKAAKKEPKSDPDDLQKLSKVPAAFWTLVMGLGSAAGLVAGGGLLLGLRY